MSTNTTNMAMGKAVDGDNAKTYHETTLAAALDKIDAHDHTGTTKGLQLSGAALSLAPISNASGVDVSLNNTGSFFDGPSVAQGTTGTWFVSGGVTITDTQAGAVFDVKLWDGTTVIDSTRTNLPGAGLNMKIALSGYIASPAGNLRISVKDNTFTTGSIKANLSGLTADSSIHAFRIG